MENPQQNNLIPYHTHNSIDAPQVDITNIRIKIMVVSDATSAPTFNAPNGTIIWLTDNTNYVQWNRINNNWKKLTMS